MERVAGVRLYAWDQFLRLSSFNWKGEIPQLHQRRASTDLVAALTGSDMLTGTSRSTAELIVEELRTWDLSKKQRNWLALS